MLILLLWCEIVKVLNISKWRAIVLAMVLILQVYASFYSNDPVTNIIFRRIPMGNYQFYSFCPTYAKEPFVRDQLVYNLQFVQLDRAIDSAMAIIKPSSGTIISANNSMLWEGRTLGPLNPLNYRRTVNLKDALLPQYLSVDQVKEKVSEGILKVSVWYIVFRYH